MAPRAAATCAPLTPLALRCGGGSDASMCTSYPRTGAYRCHELIATPQLMSLHTGTPIESHSASAGGRQAPGRRVALSAPARKTAVNKIFIQFVSFARIGLLRNKRCAMHLIISFTARPGLHRCFLFFHQMHCNSGTRWHSQKAGRLHVSAASACIWSPLPTLFQPTKFLLLSRWKLELHRMHTRPPRPMVRHVWHLWIASLQDFLRHCAAVVASSGRSARACKRAAALPP